MEPCCRCRQLPAGRGCRRMCRSCYSQAWNLRRRDPSPARLTLPGKEVVIVGGTQTERIRRMLVDALG